MAGSAQLHAGGINHELANRLTIGERKSAFVFDGDRIESKKKARLGAPIALGLLTGITAAFLVGGLAGVHQTTTEVVPVGHSAVVQSANR